MKMILLLLGIVCYVSLIGLQSQNQYRNAPAFNVPSVVSTQYSAYSGVPFPNCVDIIDNKTVVLHEVGSCFGDPFDENLKYYADFGYHVQNETLFAPMNGTTTLVKLNYVSSYRDLLIEWLNKAGVFNSTESTSTPDKVSNNSYTTGGGCGVGYHRSPDGGCEKIG